jgi:periplasmic protein TonB
MPMLQEKSEVEIVPSVSTSPVPPSPSRSDHKQRRQMLAALALLLLALILVLVKDRQFWFDSSPSTEAETSDEGDTASGAPAPAVTSPAHPITSASKPKEHTKAPSQPAAPPAMAPVVTNRAALPPLEVEVVAGDQHRTIQSGSNAVKVDMQPGVPVTPVPSEAQVQTERVPVPVTTNAAERVRMSANTVQAVTRTVEPTYPMLAKQMKVQGSVVLQALIGREGNIQDLQVVNGPTILSSAAMEAVRQWRFKPYYQSGKAVETEARITVNFTISTY